MNASLWVWATGLGCALAVLTACTPAPPPPTPTPAPIVGTGSAALSAWWPELAAGFSERYPAYDLAYDEAASVLGLEEVSSGQADFAISTDPTAPDRYPDLQFTAIAQDDLAVIVQAGAELTDISRADLRQLFAGRVQTLPDQDQTPVQLISREEGSGARATFEQTIMQDLAVSLAALIQPSDAAVVRFVGRQAGAIGYVRIASLDDSVSIVAIDGLFPGQPDYPLRRTVYLALPARPSPGAAALADWLQSPPGRNILSRTPTPAP